MVIKVKKGTVLRGNNFNIATSTGTRHVKSKKKNTGALNVDPSGKGNSSATPGFDVTTGAKSLPNDSLKKSFMGEQNSTPVPESNSPLSTSGENSTLPTTNPSASGSNPQEDLVEGSGGGGRGRKGDTAQNYASIADGTRFDTLGESLNYDWNYYKPVIGLALWEAGAAEQVLAKAGGVVGKIASKFGKSSNPKFNWAQGEIARTGMPAVTEAAGKIVPAINAKTLLGINKNLIKAGFGVTTAVYLAKEVGSSRNFSTFQLNEAIQALGMSRSRAIKVGDTESVNAIDEIQDDISNQTFWQNAASYMPWFGGNVGTSQNAKALAKLVKINKDIDAFEAGTESTDEKWARIFAEREAADEQKRLKDEAYYANIDRLAAEAKRAERAETEAYYAKILADRDKRKAEERAADEEYWDAIYKGIAERDAENTTYEPQFSKLNFGLI